MQYDKDFLLNLYKMMITIRFCEESLIEPILNGIVKCPVHLTSGQEAIAAGVSANLTINDQVFGNHRSHGHYLAKGGSLTELIGEVFCRENGCCRGRGGSMHLISPQVGFLGSAPIVAGTIALAMGAALANQIKKNNCVAVSYFGDGAAGEGVLSEALNFASINNLPLLFVCENNFYATHMKINDTRKKDSIYEIAIPYGIESAREDGNNVLNVYETSRKAIDKCRKGEGPYFIEYTTYRFRGHVGPDDNIQGTHTDIRPQKEVDQWKKRDPIVIFRRYLLNDGNIQEDVLKAVEDDIKNRVEIAHEKVKNSKTPNIRELKRYVFKKEIA